MTRAAELAAFLASTVWACAERHPLTGDASFRRYERLCGGPTPALLVDAPPPEDTTTFVRMAAWLDKSELLAPKVHAADEERGFLVVQDLGDGLLSTLCRSDPDRTTTLYGRACDELLSLQSAGLPDFLPAYDDAFFLHEIGIFVEWGLDGALGSAGRDLLDAWRAVLPLARVGPDGVVHRDFHALNLLAVGERFALIDFQGARIGPAAYDVASLLVDARLDVDNATAAAVKARYLQNRPDLAPEAFAAAFAIMAAQRSTKIVGLFQRLAVRDGKPAYLDLLPRVRTQLSVALQHPVLAPVRDWHDRHGLGS